MSPRRGPAPRKGGETGLRVLLLGAGGREHALAWKAAQSPRLKTLYAAPGSAAIGRLARCVSLDVLDPPAVAAFCRDKKIDLAIVGPEAPLEAGVADELRRAKVPVFGPGREAARLETSKAFAKEFMTRHKIPTAGYEVFREAWRARSAVEAMRLPLVIKADGLAAGKGVVVCRSTNEALGSVTSFMERKSLGRAGETIVVERCLEGPEISLMALVDKTGYRLLPPARDHKRLRDNDEGPNTGGMGAFAPARIDAATLETLKAQVLDRVLAGLAADGLEYRGVLYAGLMLTADGPKVLEFNCRFGDPETQAVLPLLDCDLLELALSCAQGALEATPLSLKPGACVSVVLASEGYPGKPAISREISGLEALESSPGLMLFHAGTTLKDGRWMTAGGRVLSVSALGRDLAEARDRAYGAAARISFEGMHYRKDIGIKELALR